MRQPGMESLGYFAVLNGWPKPAEPFRTRPLDDGNIDIDGKGQGSARTVSGRIRSRGGFELN